MSGRREVDVLVVGGGPAGAAFARTALRLGAGARARILVVDRARFPRDKTCGDGLTYRALPLIAEIFPELASRIPSRSFTSRQLLVYPGGARLRREGQELDVIPRVELDDALWRTFAGSSIETLEGAVVRDVLFDGGRAAGVRVRVGDEELEIGCRWLLGADGSNSVVRRKTGSVDGDRVITALRQYVRGVPASTEGLIFFFDVEHNGYFWIFPFERAGERWANIGYGSSYPEVSLKDRLSHYCASEEVRPFLGEGERVGRTTGFPLHLAPLRRGRIRLPRPLWSPGCLLLGDAGGLIHPLTGEGISFALQSGLAAAEVLFDPTIAEADKGAAYQRRVLRFAEPLMSELGAFLAVRVPVLLPAWLSRLYVRGGAWLQARTGWGVH